MSIKHSVVKKWTQWKPVLGGLVIGLVAGPILSAYLGWQVSTDTMREQIEATSVGVQSRVCVWRAREAAQNSAEMGYNDRLELAKKYALMPWMEAGSANYDVVSACTNELAQEPTAPMAIPKA